MKIAIAAVLAAASALPAAADSGFYVDAGYQFLSSTVEDGFGTEGELNFGALTGHAGFAFTENFAVEGEFSFGVSDEEATEEDSGTNFTYLTNASIGLNYAVGALGRVQLPLGEQFNVCARAG